MKGCGVILARRKSGTARHNAVCVRVCAVLLQVTNCMLNAGTASAVLGESGRQLYEFEAVRGALGLFFMNEFLCVHALPAMCRFWAGVGGSTLVPMCGCGCG